MGYKQKIKFSGKFLLSYMLLMLLLCAGSCEEKKNDLFDLLIPDNYTSIELFLNEFSNRLDRKMLNENGQSVMHVAAALGDIDVLKLLVKFEFDFFKKDKDNKYPIEYAKTAKIKNYIQTILNQDLANAAWKDNPELIENIIAAQANVNFLDEYYGNPFMNSIISGHLENIKVLVKAGADIDIHDYRGNILHVALLYEAKNQDTFEIVKYLLTLGIDPNEKDIHGQSALFYTKNLNIAKALVDAGCDIHIVDKLGRTALFNMMTDKTKNIAELLVQKGASNTHQDYSGNTLLHYCGDEDAREGIIVSYMIMQKVNLNTVNEYGLTPLHVAAAGMYNNGDTHEEALYSRVNPKAVELLLSAGASPEIKDKKGRTALFYAAECGSLEACKSLLNYGANINTPTTDRLTPLKIAQQYEHGAVIQLFQSCLK